MAVAALVGVVLGLQAHTVAALVGVVLGLQAHTGRCGKHTGRVHCIPSVMQGPREACPYRQSCRGPGRHAHTLSHAGAQGSMPIQQLPHLRQARSGST